jgi:hypothetical protein
MSMNSVACTGTVVHPYYVLTTADCVHNSTGLYILPPSSQPVSLYKVWTQYQHALLQTHSALLTSSICLARRGGWQELAFEGVTGMLLGYKKNSKEEDSMFYSDVIINEAPDEASDTVLEYSDLHRWVSVTTEIIYFIISSFRLKEVLWLSRIVGGRFCLAL